MNFINQLLRFFKSKQPNMEFSLDIAFVEAKNKEFGNLVRRRSRIPSLKLFLRTVDMLLKIFIKKKLKLCF